MLAAAVDPKNLADIESLRTAVLNLQATLAEQNAASIQYEERLAERNRVIVYAKASPFSPHAATWT